MTRISSQDPRAQNTQQALKAASMELLLSKPLQRITVTDIANRAGIARHTFYNHFDTRDALLDVLVDSVLEGFFSDLGNWEISLLDPAQELSMFTSFFQAWKDNREIIQLLRIPEMEELVIRRLQFFFTNLFRDKIKEALPGVSIHLANYVINFNAYSLVGILKAWLNSGMLDSPRHLGGLLQQLGGSRQRLRTIQEYQTLLTG